MGARHLGALGSNPRQVLCVLLGQGEGRGVRPESLSDMSSRELKRRFEVFGEIVECQVLTRSKAV